MPPVVVVDKLTKAYGARPPALIEVTLEVREGVTGLLGPNGAGKSTLLQCVLGLLRDFHGDATVLGLDARRDRLEIRRRVGYMPESDSLLPRMSGVTAVPLPRPADRHVAPPRPAPRARVPPLRRPHRRASTAPARSTRRACASG